MTAKLGIAAVMLAATLPSALAETAAERRACMGDAFSFCSRYIPNRGQVAACLARNIDQISPACRMVMQSYPAPDPDRRPARYQRPFERP